LRLGLSLQIAIRLNNLCQTSPLLLLQEIVLLGIQLLLKRALLVGENVLLLELVLLGQKVRFEGAALNSEGVLGTSTD